MCQENVYAKNGLKSRFVIQKSEFVNVKSRKKDFMLYNLNVHMFWPTNISSKDLPPMRHSAHIVR